MVDSDPRIAIAALQERIGALDRTISSAHSRVDKMESLVRDDLKEIKTNFAEVSREIKELTAYMNRSRGWAAAFLLIAGLVGGFIVKLIR